MTLVLPFDSDEAEFRRGVEVGMLWTMVREREPAPAAMMIHSDNAEMVIRIAEACELPFTAAPASEDWLYITIGPKAP
jgi:diphthamide synthase (EF-2-diphthine--ammonia ligase)